VGEEVYALVNKKWVSVKVQKRKAAWILFSCTYRYDVLQGEEQLQDIHESDIMTVEEYKKRFANVIIARSGKNEEQKELFGMAAAHGNQSDRDIAKESEE
jgi:hypothetical protein